MEIFRGERDPRRRPGKPGVDVILLDLSGSMTGAIPALKIVLGSFLLWRPKARLIGFGERAGYISALQIEATLMGVGNETMGLELAAPLEPNRTYVISDGGFMDFFLENDLKVIDRMSGSVTAVYLSAYSGGQKDRENMQRIARRGGGNFCDWGYGTNPWSLRRFLKEAPIPSIIQEPEMSKNQLPDRFLEDDEFEFDLPEEVVVDLRRKYTLLRGTVITEQFHEPEWHKNGGPVRQRIGVQPPQITINEPRGVISKALGWLTNAPEVEAPREVNRGFLQEAPQQAALPSSGPVLALPAPSRPALVPQLSDSREQPMDSAERVAAIFRKR